MAKTITKEKISSEKPDHDLTTSQDFNEEGISMWQAVEVANSYYEYPVNYFFISYFTSSFPDLQYSETDKSQLVLRIDNKRKDITSTTSIMIDKRQALALAENLMILASTMI